MLHRIMEDQDGNIVQEFDDEAIEWFIDGLVQLRGCEPGESLATPSIIDDENGMPESVGQFILMKVEVHRDEPKE